MGISNLPENIPFIIFGLILSVVFIIFLRGVFYILTAGKNGQKIEKGRRILLNSLYGFFVVLLVILVFFSVTYLLGKGEKLKPSSLPGEFPPSPAANYPPSPQFVKIGKYYFNGPGILANNNIIATPLLYTVLCKKDNEYDIIYIGSVGNIDTTTDLFKHEQYDCWLKNCDQDDKNLYVAFFPFSLEEFRAEEEEKIQQNLEEQTSPHCSVRSLSE